MNKRKVKYPDFVDEKNIKIENYGYDNNKFRFLLKVPFKTSGQNYILPFGCHRPIQPGLSAG